jgi:adenosylmethionine-8-amino-7-oxononanoate aminotransferase
MLWGLEFVADRDTREPYPFEAAIGQRATVLAADEGLLIYPRRGGGGLSGDHVLIAPPLTIAEDEIDELLERLDRALTRLAGELADAA